MESKPIQKLVEDIKESKAQIIKDENNDTSNENDVDIDIDDWEQVETLLLMNLKIKSTHHLYGLNRKNYC